VDTFLLFVMAGLLTGWLAGKLIKYRRLGTLGSMVVGVLGAMFGGYVYDLTGLEISGLLGTIIAALFGAVVMLFGARILDQA
jgi:uncharacterized membrane protein YeaQ/YmgE (transglycosylase-associated protein family)